MQGVNIEFTCAVVELGPGNIKVTLPGEAYTERRCIGADYTGPGKYGQYPHFFVSGDVRFSSSDQFRVSVDTVVNGLLAKATPENPVTLDDIKAALPATLYTIEYVKPSKSSVVPFF